MIINIVHKTKQNNMSYANTFIVIQSLIVMIKASVVCMLFSSSSQRCFHWRNGEYI